MSIHNSKQETNKQMEKGECKKKMKETKGKIKAVGTKVNNGTGTMYVELTNGRMNFDENKTYRITEE